MNIMLILLSKINKVANQEFAQEKKKKKDAITIHNGKA